MVQSDLPRGQTKSGRVNAKWYLERLKASARNHQDFKGRNCNSTIRVVRGTTATQGQHFPRVYLTSPTKAWENHVDTSFDNEHSNVTMDIRSSTSFKSASTKNGPSSQISQSNCRSSRSRKMFEKDERDNSLHRRSSSATIASAKTDLIARPPSTPVDPRCQRDYSATRNSIQRETCELLGPQLCSDCIEIQTRSNLSAERLPINLIRQRLSALAIRPFLPNEQFLSDEHLFQMMNNQQIQMVSKPSELLTDSIRSDEEYFQHLSSSLNQSAHQTPFYFRDLKDFAQKYQSNEYPRLFLSENEPPKSSNPLFQQSSIEKFDVSSKYSSMKRASTAKPNLQSKSIAFISPRKSEQFYNQHRFLTNYSPPLLFQTSQENTRKFSNPLNSAPLTFNYQTSKRSLINSKHTTKTILT